MLVNRVGHERANATAEVRRSFIGTYPPLYQIAYMMEDSSSGRCTGSWSGRTDDRSGIP